MAVTNQEDCEEGDVSCNEKMANDRNIEPNQKHCKAGPSQLAVAEDIPFQPGEDGLEPVSPIQGDLTPSHVAVEDPSPSKTGEYDLERTYSMRADFTRFIERMIEAAKRTGVYEFMDGYGDADTESTTDNSVKSKDKHQLAVQEASPSEIAEDDLEWASQMHVDFKWALPGRVDFTGFIEQMIVDGKKTGVYDSFDGYGDTDRKSTTDDPVKSKDEHQLSHTDNLDDSTPDHILDSTDEGPQSSSKKTLTSKLPLSQPASPKGFDDLCSLMRKTNIQKSTQEVAMRSTIPKGYQSGIVSEANDHYGWLTFYKAGIERRPSTGGKRKRDDIGFKPHEVMKSGALHSKYLEEKCSLTGDIHPIFHESHWTDTPDQFLEIIKPSLLLATKLLSTPQCLQHFQTVLKGRREHCVDTSFRKSKDCYRIKEDVLLTPESVLDLKAHIESMAGSLTFQFSDAFNLEEAHTHFAYAIQVPCNHSSCSISSTEKVSSRQTAAIALHPDFYVQAQKLCRLKYPDPAQVLRFHFFLTVCIMHEFSHAFEIARCPDETRKGMEVYMYDWLTAESGRAWEKALFGGWVTVINDRVDGLHGICVKEWPEPGLTDPERKGQGYNWTVPMTFIEGLFQESFWTDLQSKEIGERHLLIVPETGALSCGINTFSTAIFEEVIKERELGSMELALREVEGVALIDEEEDTKGEERRKRIKGEKGYIPQAWLKKMGRTPFDKHFG